MGIVAGPVEPKPSLGLYVRESGSGEDDEVGEERMPIAMFMPMFMANW